MYCFPTQSSNGGIGPPMTLPSSWLLLCSTAQVQLRSSPSHFNTLMRFLQQLSILTCFVIIIFFLHKNLQGNPLTSFIKFYETFILRFDIDECGKHLCDFESSLKKVDTNLPIAHLHWSFKLFKFHTPCVVHALFPVHTLAPRPCRALTVDLQSPFQLSWCNTC